MGNAILDVVLGLVLIYATLALLVSKVQEMLDGNLMRGRVSTLHDLVKEAVGQSDDLKKKVLANPLIYALYRGDSAKGHIFLRSSGPTAIPPELFARVLLIELNDGKHPSEQFASPSAFLTARTSATKDPEIWKVLGGLLAGREGNWTDFTAAVAEWYTHIGDRSEGWFKRRAQWWSFWTSLILAVLLNVDSLHIAKTLSQDSELRGAFADIAERVAEQRASEAAAPPAAPLKAATLAPEDVAAARLTEAIHSLTDAVALDKKGGFATFKADGFRGETKNNKEEQKKEGGKGKESNTGDGGNSSRADSNQGDSDKPICAFPIGSRQAPSDNGRPPVSTQDWLYALPIVRSGIEDARTDDHSSVARKTYKNAHRCLSHLSSWLAVAETFASTDAVRRSVRDATVAIEQAKTALLTLVAQRAAFLSLRRSYQTDPEAVRECREVATAPADFSASVEQALRSRVRLPILPLQTTLSLQFCEVAASANDRFPPPAWPCDALPLAAKDTIGVSQALYLSQRDGVWWQWFAGVLITALFAALGAPFWFDVLGRVVKLRAAGRTRDEAAAEARAGGKTPPPVIGAGTPPRAEPPGPATGPFASSRNAFEDGLVARDIVALQQALTSLQPTLQATGQLDQPTRLAIAAWCRGNDIDPATEELSRELYQRIVGRSAVRTPAAPATANLRLNEISSQVQPVATRLMTMLGFPKRIPDTETRFSAELRALAVLYRYKREDKTEVIRREVFDLARKTPASLDEVDAKLLDEILKLPDGKTFSRENPGWLDWAIGELGQVEAGASNRANSNKRICEYLDAAEKGMGDAGDNTSWCGAFVNWVLEQHRSALPAGSAPPPKLTGNPLKASDWMHWGTPRGGADPGTLTGAQAGDVIVFKPEPGSTSSGHVAFVIAHDAATGKVWALGGNQKSGTRVCLSQFDAADVMAVRCI